MNDQQIYEYAGFRYYVDIDAIGTVRMRPVEGQHYAAAKDKHVRAARESYMADRKRGGNSGPRGS